MMKRIISIVLIVCFILIGAPAYAAPAETSTEKTLNLSFSDIEGLVKGDNLTYKNNRVLMQNMDESLSKDVYWALSDSLNLLSTVQANTKNVLIEIETARALTPDTDNPSLKGASTSLQNDLILLELSVKQLDAQMDQYYNAPRATIDKSVEQLENANKQIIWGAESLFMAFHTLSLQIDQTKKNLETLNSNIKALEHRYSLGLIARRTLMETNDNRSTLEQGIKSMENELVSLKGQLNLLLGRKHDAPLNIGNMPDAKKDYLKTVDPVRDLRDATSKNHLVAIALIEIDEQSSSKTKNARNLETVARNSYTNEVRNVEFRYDSLSRAIKDKESALALAESQLANKQRIQEETKRKFELGLVSRVELEQAERDSSLQTISVSSANAELFAAIRQYEWLIKGMSA